MSKKVEKKEVKVEGKELESIKQELIIKNKLLTEGAEKNYLASLIQDRVVRFVKEKAISGGLEKSKDFSLNIETGVITYKENEKKA